MAASMSRPAFWRRALKFAAIFVAGLLAVPYLLTPLYLFGEPVSTLMLARWAAGERVERHWVPLDAMAPGVRWIGYLLPLTYFTMISQGVMLRGASLASLWIPFAVLTVMAIVVFTGATLRFRRDLAPGRRRKAVEERHEHEAPTS